MKRLLLLATTTGYQTRMFGEAAARLGVELVYATDRCDRIEDPWADGAIAVRYQAPAESLETLRARTARRSLDGVLAVGDRPVVLAAMIARHLGLPSHPPEAAATSCDKRLLRTRLRDAGLPAPEFITVPSDADPASAAGRLPYPVVVKPTTLSGSRGVIRADDDDEFKAACERVQRLLHAPEVRTLHDDQTDVIQIERYVDGDEYAVEAVLEHGRVRILATFDKPDPLRGPFFEETIYVTPSRADATRQGAIADAITQAVRAMGLHHGPLHAECRVTDAGEVFVLEVAARPIGGLCARALRFVDGAAAAPIGLEELLLRHAVGEPLDPWTREPAASGVMMIPIPRKGLYRRVTGVDEARAVPGIDEVAITAKTDQMLVPLPEGASYLGFIFARAGSAADVERRLREAHARLRFEIDAAIPVVAEGRITTGAGQLTGGGDT